MDGWRAALKIIGTGFIQLQLTYLARCRTRCPVHNHWLLSPSSVRCSPPFCDNATEQLLPSSDKDPEQHPLTDADFVYITSLDLFRQLQPIISHTLPLIHVNFALLKHTSYASFCRVWCCLQPSSSSCIITLHNLHYPLLNHITQFALFIRHASWLVQCLFSYPSEISPYTAVSWNAH